MNFKSHYLDYQRHNGASLWGELKFRVVRQPALPIAIATDDR
jgi:hypothetical protein